MSKLLTLYEFCLFLKSRKKYWLIPVICFIFLLGILICSQSFLTPFIYALF